MDQIYRKFSDKKEAWSEWTPDIQNDAKENLFLALLGTANGQTTIDLLGDDAASLNILNIKSVSTRIVEAENEKTYSFYFTLAREAVKQPPSKRSLTKRLDSCKNKANKSKNQICTGEQVKNPMTPQDFKHNVDGYTVQMGTHRGGNCRTIAKCQIVGEKNYDA
ncbi:MAG: hypothetical protein Q9164_006640 [Protoblastenia rupestris]